MNAIARDLRPAELDDLGLVVALGAVVTEWSLRTGVQCDASSRNCDVRLPSAIETALYRITQEALANVARHSRARHASVVIECRENDVVVVIEDDGVGFDVQAAGRGDRPRVGLVGMRERAALLGGTVVVESTPQGTSVFVTVPLSPAAHL